MVRASFVVVVGLLLAAGCRDDPRPTLPLAPDVEAAIVAEVGCGELLSAAEVVDVDARFEAIGAVISAVREGQCPATDDEARLCRSLFLIAASDPLVGVGAGLDTTQIEQLIEWHRWAFLDGVEAAGNDAVTAEALERMGQIDVGAAVLNGDTSTVVDAAVARADPSIIEPLEAAEQVCLSLPR